ncbi:MAG: hypothetical protein MUF19_04515 [Candidatus Pacebacteria bacterium]|jgi:hypothetical protein|nr:hypothetical protein [Candidatus Paceibacterota bacterium]
MPKDGRVTIGKNWKPPADFDPRKFFKKRTAYRHISKVEPPDGTRQERIRLFINEPLTEAEKTTFGQRLVQEHREWFGCACWSHGGLAVRISIKTGNTEVLSTARMEVATHVDAVLVDIFATRAAKP